MRPYRVPVLIYHRVYQGADRSLERMGIHITLPRFRSQMEWLRRRGYRTLSLDEVAAAAEGTPVSGNCIAITFDDGFEDTATNALPVLQECGFSATVFLVSDYIGGLNQWDISAGLPASALLDLETIRTMQRAGVWFGSHGAAHRKLTLLSPEERAREIAGSRERLEDLLGAPVRHFSYPYLAANPEIEAIVEAAGYRSACAGDRAEHRPFLLSRIDISQDGRAMAAWKLSQLRFRLRANGLLRRARARLRQRRPAPLGAAGRSWSGSP